MLANLFAKCEQQHMMTLEQYLAEEKQTQRDFAQSLGMSPSYMNEIVKGVKCPSLSLALKIVNATDGKVSIAALLRQAEAGGISDQADNPATPQTQGYAA